MTGSSLYAVAQLGLKPSPPSEPRDAAGPEVESVPEDVLHQVFGAPWRQISRMRLAPGGSLGPRTLKDTEMMLFVEAGGGCARTAEGDGIPLVAEMALTLIQGERLHVEAGRDGLALYVVEIGVGSE